MAKHYDAHETRSIGHRDRQLFRDLRELLEAKSTKVPGLRKPLRGIDLKTLKDRQALAEIPVFRKSDLVAQQKRLLPFGGLAGQKPSAMKRLLVSPGPVFEPQGYGRDWWGAARALFAAGFRKGDIVHNTFSYHLTPGGHIMESGAHALKCAVIPAGTGNTEQQIEAMLAYQPNAYCGTPDFLKILLEKAIELNTPLPFLKKALVSGAAFPASLQAEIASHGIDAYQAYATADLGVIAYETSACDGLVCNENLIVEIVRPGTNDPVTTGEVGEVVVTRLNPDYPLLRFGTGDLSRVMEGASACGRTNMRLAGWLGRADQSTKVKGMFVTPTQVNEIARRHPEIGRLRLTVSRAKEQDKMMLQAECGVESTELKTKLVASLQAITKLKGSVELVPLQSLPNDGKIIHDARNA